MSTPQQRIKLAREYLKAFERKDLKFISEIFPENIALQDSFIGRVEGKPKVLSEYKNIFDAHKKIALHEKRVFESENGCGIEFQIQLTTLDDKNIEVEGIDLFQFTDMNLVEIRAYIELKK